MSGPVRGDAPNDLALATCITAAFPGGDPVAAADSREGVGDRPWHVARTACHGWFHGVTQDRIVFDRTVSNSDVVLIEVPGKAE